MSQDEAEYIKNNQDINDVFESLTFLEDNLGSNGFKEGIEKGKIDGEIEGYHLGYHRGAEIGSEIGYYVGFLEALKKTLDRESLSQICGVIEKLDKLIESFPHTNDETTNIIVLRDNIRSTYKRLCSLLKIEFKTSGNTQLSF